MAPTGDNVSARLKFQYRSASDVVRGGSALPPAKLVLAQPGQAKPSTVRCWCQVSGRRECTSSLSAVRSCIAAKNAANDFRLTVDHKKLAVLGPVAERRDAAHPHPP